jgi:hypothetical protein
VGTTKLRKTRHQPSHGKSRDDADLQRAMVAPMETLLTGDVLAPRSRTQLVDWISGRGASGTLIRASTPERWHVADKSGSGDFNRNMVAMVPSPERRPYRRITVGLTTASAMNCCPMVGTSKPGLTGRAPTKAAMRFPARISSIG